MASLFSRRAFRTDPFLRVGLGLSFAVSLLLLVIVHTPSGDYFGGFSDHLHHPRATYNFFVLGLEVYRTGHGELCHRVPYSYHGAFWPFYPVAYPPGMFAVFAIPAVVGRFRIFEVPGFGKFVIAYLLIITQASSWAFTRLARRIGSTFWMVFAAFVWMYMLRTALTGFYDGAWLLAAAVAVHAMSRNRPAAAVLWFVAAAMMSYRAASLAPLALVAYWHLLRGTESLRTKLLVTLVAATSSVIIVLCFWALVHYGPHDQDSAHSSLVPFYFYSWFLLGFGLVVAAALAWGTTILVGACVALCTVLAIYHAGHTWHGTVCMAPLFAIVLSKRRPLWAQATLAVWFAFNLQYVFGFGPFQFLDDVLSVIQRGGAEYH